MAKPQTAKGTKLLLLLGNGADPEVFTKICAVTAKGINFQTNTNEYFVPDCDNPDDPAWREMTKSGRFADISGSGTLDMAALARIRAAYNDENAINVRVQLDVSPNGGYWEGPFMFNGFNIAGNDGELVQLSDMSIQSAGAVAWVDA